jgi:hypothetical protein
MYSLNNVEEKMSSGLMRIISVLLLVLTVGVPVLLLFNEETFNTLVLLWLDTYESVINGEFKINLNMQTVGVVLSSVISIGFGIIVALSWIGLNSVLCSFWLKHKFKPTFFLKVSAISAVAVLVAPGLFPILICLSVFCLVFAAFAWLLHKSRDDVRAAFLIAKIACAIIAVGLIIFGFISFGSNVALALAFILAGIVCAALVVVILFLDGTLAANFISKIVFMASALLFLFAALISFVEFIVSLVTGAGIAMSIVWLVMPVVCVMFVISLWRMQPTKEFIA